MTKDRSQGFEEIRARLADNRAKLTESVQDLVEENKPKNIAKRFVSDGVQFAEREYQATKNYFQDEHGWRLDRIATVGGAVLGFIVFAVTVNSITGKSRQQLCDEALKALEA